MPAMTWRKEQSAAATAPTGSNGQIAVDVALPECDLYHVTGLCLDEAGVMVIIEVVTSDGNVRALKDPRFTSHTRESSVFTASSYPIGAGEKVRCRVIGARSAGTRVEINAGFIQRAVGS